MGFSASLSLSVGAWCCMKLKSTSYACHSHRIIYIVLYITLSEEEMKISRLFMGHLSLLRKLEPSMNYLIKVTIFVTIFQQFLLVSSYTSFLISFFVVSATWVCSF